MFLTQAEMYIVVGIFGLFAGAILGAAADFLRNKD